MASVEVRGLGRPGYVRAGTFVGVEQILSVERRPSISRYEYKAYLALSVYLEEVLFGQIFIALEVHDFFHDLHLSRWGDGLAAQSDGVSCHEREQGPWELVQCVFHLHRCLLSY